MPDDNPIYLVVGSDSLIGGALLQRFLSAGEQAVGTTRRREQISQRLLYLDLLDGAEKWEPASSMKVAVLCAGVTRLQACESDPAGSARINVDGIAALAENLSHRGIFFIYLSTNQVFDGTKPFRQAADPVSPKTEYGRQKAAAEREVAKYGEAAAIIRFSKVLEPNPVLFSTWTETMQSGDVIYPFSDMFMAPVPVSSAVESLRGIAHSRSSGIFQMSADQDISYEQAARHLARGLGLNEALIRPIPTAESGLNLGPLASHTTLDGTRLHSEFGIAPPNAWSVIESSIKA